MIIRQEGIINNIIYDNTVYHNNMHRIYPTLVHLENIIKKIIQSKSTTNFIRIIPFYKSSKFNFQVEFDEYMFFIESRNKISDFDYDIFLRECADRDFDKEGDPEFLKKCADEAFKKLTSQQLIDLKTQFVLCKHNDFENFGAFLVAYLEYQNIIIPKMVDELVQNYNMKQEDLFFGHFCYELNSH